MLAVLLVLVLAVLPAYGTPTPAATPTATHIPLSSAGDCNGDGCVTIDELVRAVRIALFLDDASECPAAIDCNGHLGIHIDCLIASVFNALRQCGHGATVERASHAAQ